MSEVVARTGVAPSTIRYYVSTGLIPPARRVARRRHLYDERHVESLRLVKLLKERRKMPVDAVRKILPALLELPADGAFRPEMWEQLVQARVLSPKSSPGRRLLEAGIAAFTRHSYGEVRVDDVCRAAKIAKGSFYRHYPSKEELFFASARETARRVEVRLSTLLAERGPSGTVQATGASQGAFLEALADALEPNLALLLALMTLAAQRRPGHGRVLLEVLDELDCIVRSELGTSAAADETALAEELLERALVIAARRLVLSPLDGEQLGRAELA